MTRGLSDHQGVPQVARDLGRSPLSIHERLRSADEGITKLVSSETKVSPLLGCLKKAISPTSASEANGGGHGLLASPGYVTGGTQFVQGQ